MTILCVGDIHIKSDNLHLVDLLEQQILEYVLNYSVRLVILLGDVLDTFDKIYTPPLNRAYKLIRHIREQTEVAILVGNHDYINNQQFLSDAHWMNAMKDWSSVYVIDNVKDLCVHGLRIVLVPYVPPQRFQEALSLIPDWHSVQYIFAHQEFRGCKMGAITSSHGDEWREDYPMVISGHIHDNQRPQPNIYYIGASIQNSFGDQTSPKLLLIKGEELRELDLHLPKKKTIYTNLEQLAVENIQKNLETAETEMVRVVVKCDYEQFKVFTKSKEYDQLVKHSKCKIVHKPVATNAETTKPDPVVLESKFEQLLLDKVLMNRDEFLYSMYHEVVHDTSLDPDHFLII